MSQFKSVSVVSYYMKDWEKAKKFYQETLEWPVIFSGDEFGWIEYGFENTTHLAISRWDGPEPVPPKLGGGTAVLEVADAKKVTAGLRTRGVKCDDVIEIQGMMCYGTFYDPEGNRIQFASDPTK